MAGVVRCNIDPDQRQARKQLKAQQIRRERGMLHFREILTQIVPA
jgi:hypothetical protein